MSDAVTERAAAIRDYLDRAGKDRVLSRNYATVAARWEQLRYAQHRGQTSPGDDTRLRELAGMVQTLGEGLGLGSEPPGSGWRGFLPLDPCRIICTDWLDASAMWFG